jgi:hypothetical protein
MYVTVQPPVLEPRRPKAVLILKHYTISFIHFVYDASNRDPGDGGRTIS